MNTAHQVRVGGKPAAGRSKRFKAAKNHALAAALQSRFSEGSHKYHESPQRVNMKRRQAVKLQQGIHLTHLVIGAAQLGKCAGFSPHPGAQTKALESMLKQQNPARYQAFFDRHGCASDKQLAQQLISKKAPQLQTQYAAITQLGNFEDPADSRQVCSTAASDWQATLQATRQAAADKQEEGEAAEAAHREEELQIASAAAATAAAGYILDVLLLQLDAAIVHSNTVAAPASDNTVDSSTQAHSAHENTDSSNAAAETVADVNEQGTGIIIDPVLPLSETALPADNMVASSNTQSDASELQQSCNHITDGWAKGLGYRV